MQSRCLLVLASMVLLSLRLIQADEIGTFEKPIEPKETIKLFNGRDLTGWYTWLTDSGKDDPRKVFTVGADGILRISGDGLGAITTEMNYANYHLVAEFRWGEKTWGNREKAARDSGILLHAYGPDGGYGGSNGKPGPWMTSLECQIIEGGVGDILVVQGVDESGKKLEVSALCEVTKDRDGESVWKAGGEKKRFTSGRINWYGRDPDWKDVIGFRGKDDVESPGKEWTKLEVYCDGSKLTYVVNGIVVNRAVDVFPNRGRLLVQTEGAEIFFRKIELHPLPDKRP